MVLLTADEATADEANWYNAELSWLHFGLWLFLPTGVAMLQMRKRTGDILGLGLGRFE